MDGSWKQLLAVGIAAPLTACRTPTQIEVDLSTDIPCTASPSTNLYVGGSPEALASRSPVVQTTRCGATGHIGSVVMVPSTSNDAFIALKVLLAHGDRTIDQCQAADLASEPLKGCIVARRSLRFVPHTELLLPIEMLRDCDNVACPANETCVRGKCLSAAVRDSAICRGAGCPSSILWPVDAGSGDSDAPSDSSVDQTHDTTDASVRPDTTIVADATHDPIAMDDVSDAAARDVVDDESGPADALEESLIGRVPLRINVSLAADATGTVVSVSSPVQPDIECATTCDVYYQRSTTVFLSAKPGPGAFFGGWEGDCSATADATCVVTMDFIRSVSARITTTANTVFWTSTRYSLTDLAQKGSGSSVLTPDAVLAGADAVCAEVAATPPSLAPPGKYIAWMSSLDHDAINRLKAANGGVAPRGWMRIDRKPFLDRISNRVLYPSLFNEKGVAGTWRAYTGTAPDGSGLLSNCSDWKSASVANNAIFGQSDVGGDSWSGLLGLDIIGCNLSQSVLCMQVDHTSVIVVPLPASQTKRAFFAGRYDTSTGLAGADALCRSDADRAGLVGTFRALLATKNASAASRFHPSEDNGYVRTDGVVVTEKDNYLFMPSPPLLAPIAVDATGLSYAGPAPVYTGAVSPTALATENCNDWTDSTSRSKSLAGLSTALGSQSFYSPDSAIDCSQQGTIYCLED